MALKTVPPLDESSSNEPSTEKLRETTEYISTLAQDVLSEIECIAKLALAYLETPGGYKHPEIIAKALDSIWGRAEYIKQCISNQAEDVGCDYVDEAEIRRSRARYAAMGASHV
ncbi:MAG: hypothetical protein ABI605_14650 [Rhizobacter sp.]